MKIVGFFKKHKEKIPWILVVIFISAFVFQQFLYRPLYRKASAFFIERWVVVIFNSVETNPNRGIRIVYPNDPERFLWVIHPSLIRTNGGN